jgi:hypothetical protein
LQRSKRIHREREDRLFDLRERRKNRGRSENL